MARLPQRKSTRLVMNASAAAASPGRISGGGHMAKTRREFLTEAAVGLAAAAASAAGVAPAEAQDPSKQPAGAPPAFGTGPGVGPQVSVNTFTEAEKLVQIELTKPQLEMAASSWRGNLAAVYERRTGPHKLELPSSVVPYSSWNPVLPGRKAGPDRDQFVRSKTDPGPLPKNEDEIAFAPVTRLSRWVETRQITSERLTQIYLKRLEQFNPKLRCVITLTKELALAQAKQADAEIAAGKYRSPLHGIPWGGKDLLDTAGIPTTYGAEPFKDRLPKDDAAVVQRLHAAGAVLIAKLSLGALALNDIWFGGQTMNPWLLEEGSSGSSAGPGSATAAGLVGFAIGTETSGSILSPSARCGVTGLRPTFGRISRYGVMALSWTQDRLGPMCRYAEDCAVVMSVIARPDNRDMSVSEIPFNWNAHLDIHKLRVGYLKDGFEEVRDAAQKAMNDKAIEQVQALGFKLVPV